MKQSLQQAIEDELPDADYPEFEPGDKIRVTTTQSIQGQQRKRHFEGVCIARRGEGPDKTFKVRKVSFGVGVERIYPLYSPIIDEIKIVKKGKVRRAKLTYLEGRSAKDSRIEEERADLEELNRTRAGVAGEKAPEDESEETAGDTGTEATEESTDDQPADTVEESEADRDRIDEDENDESAEVESGETEAVEESDEDDEARAEADEPEEDDEDTND